jgi:hypothetical protein
MRKCGTQNITTTFDRSRVLVHIKSYSKTRHNQRHPITALSQITESVKTSLNVHIQTFATLSQHQSNGCHSSTGVFENIYGTFSDEVFHMTQSHSVQNNIMNHRY